VKAARSRWQKRQDWLKHHLHLLSRIVFIDETGLNTKMARLRGRSAKGQRLVAAIPHGHWKTMTFIAGLRHDGMTAPWVLDGPMDGPAFVTYIKTQLAPTLQKGDVVVMDIGGGIGGYSSDITRMAVIRTHSFCFNNWCGTE
jgi:hypothetical protein